MLNRLTRLAATICQAPVALIMVVETERQFFVSQVGLTAQWAQLQETPLPKSLWHPPETLEQTLIVEAISEDSISPLVSLGKGLNMAAYLKVPLKSSRKDILGYVCVMSPQPKAWQPSSLEGLTDIAAIAAREIEQVACRRVEQGLATPDPYLNELAQTNEILAQTLSSLKLNLNQLSAKVDYRTLVEQVPAIIYINSLENGNSTLYVSPQVQEILGYAPDQCLVDAQFWHHVIHPDDYDWITQARARANTTQQTFQREYRMVRQDGEIIWVRDEAVLVKDTAGHPKCWQGIILDITARRLLEAQLAHQATHDALTGLANRVHFVSCLESALQNRNVHDDGLLAVLFLDLDDFKTINDSLGHRVGDQVLIEVAARLNQCFETLLGQVARFGGDEFVILLEAVPSLTGLRSTVQRLLDTFEEPILWQGILLPIHISVGVALNVPHQMGVDQLLQNADIAMYEAKRSGKGCYRLFQAGMQVSLV